MKYPLRDYQQHTIDAINKALSKGVNKQLAVLATGLGKTIIFSHLISERIEQTKKKALIIAHREELLQQAKEKLRLINPDLQIGIEQAENHADHTSDDVVIASVATIGREQSNRIASFNPQEYSTLIIDEAHHASAATYKNILKHFGVLKNTPSDWNKHLLLVGVTATPSRNDNQGIDQIFDEVVYKYDIIDGIKNNWLSTIKAIKITTATDISTVTETAGDYTTSELSKAVNNPHRNQLILQTYQEQAQDKQTLIFAADVQHTQDLFLLLQTAGIKVAYITGETEKAKRAELLQNFANKTITVMINAMVLTEGYDNENIQYIFMTRPTKSSILYQQMIGRGTRIAKDKEHLMIVDFVDNTTSHTLKTSASLVGIESSINFQGEDIVAWKEKLDELREKRPFYDLDELNINNIDYLIKEVDLMEKEAKQKEQPNFIWHKTGDSFRIGIGENRYFIIDQPLTGQTILYKYNHEIDSKSFVGEFSDYTEARKHADYLISQNYYHKANISTTETWENDIPSEAQISLLRQYGVAEEKLLMLSKGEASQLISKLKHR